MRCSSILGMFLDTYKNFVEYISNPQMFPEDWNPNDGDPRESTIDARDREDSAYFHRQWLCFNGPGQTGRRSESRSHALGWLVNHLPTT